VTEYGPTEPRGFFAHAFFVAASEGSHSERLSKQFGKGEERPLLHFCSLQSPNGNGTKEQKEGDDVLHIDLVRPRSVKSLDEAWLPSPVPFVQAEAQEAVEVEETLEESLDAAANSVDAVEDEDVQEQDYPRKSNSSVSVTSSILGRELSARQRAGVRRTFKFLVLTNVVFFMVILVLATIVIWNSAEWS